MPSDESVSFRGRPIANGDLRPSVPWRIRQQLLALLPGTFFLAVFVFRSGMQTSGALSSMRFTLFDDAMISMTYARTLAETGEWVWFPGADRVQGFTNPLWTLYMAMIHRLGLHDSSAALVVSLTGGLVLVLSGLAVGRLVSEVLGKDKPGTWAAWISGGTIPFIYPLTYWTLRGMEVGLLALLALVAVLGLVGALKMNVSGKSSMGPLLVLATAGATGIAVRFDFIVVLAPLLFFSLLWAPTRRSRTGVVFTVCLPLAIVALGVVVFQYDYWGDWLPNTYRLKMEGFGIHERVGRGLVTAAKTLPLLVLAGISLTVVLGLTRELWVRRTALSLVAVGTTPIAYSIWVGGDAWDNFQMLNRYVAVGTPALVALFFIGLGMYLQQPGMDRKGWLSAVIAVLLLCSSMGLALLANPLNVSPHGLAVSLGAVGLATATLWLALRWHCKAPNAPARSVVTLCALALVVVATTSSSSGLFWLGSAGQYVMADQYETDVGLVIRDVSEPSALVAVLWAGAPAYYARRSMVDLLGKSDRVIATGPPAVDRNSGQAVEFAPGHSKFDALYSVKQLRPDMVVELPWDADDSEMRQWGYLRRCAGDGTAMYFLSSSPNIRWHRLYVCP